MSIKVELLREAILEKYGTQQKFAKKTGYAEAQISRALVTQSPKFIQVCRKAGIDIDALKKKQYELEVMEKLKLNDPQRRIMELEQLVKDQKEIIDLVKKVLEKIGSDKSKK